ncbi:hypothetical protein AAHJ11_14315 [Bacteroides sp. 90-K9/2]|uniref:O-antigen ligase family protein n=1 Tax=Bacteroides sp. 90-K9/2 TaxID=3142453 RepID=UPI0039B5A77D
MNERFLLLTSLLLFHSIFVYLDDGSGIGRIIQAMSTVALIALLLVKRKYKLLPQFKTINRLVVIYCIGLFVISYLSKDINMNSLDSLRLGNKEDLRLSSYTLGILQALSVLTSFIYIEYLSSINKTEILFRTFYKVSLFYIIISDLVFLVIGSIGEQGYLIGNKFSLCYMHILCYVFYYIYSYKRNVIPNKCISIMLIIMTLLMSILAECTTTLLGMLVIVFLFNTKRRFGFILFKLKTYVIILSLGVLFIFFYSFILDIQIVQDFIVNILHEDITLTGRTEIYDALIPILSVRPLWGVGVGNSHWVLAYLLGVANAQNGLVNLYIEEGLTCTVLYLLIFISVFKYVKDKIAHSFSYPLLCYILFFFIVGLVEITIDNKLLVVISFLIAYDYNKYNHICQK